MASLFQTNAEMLDTKTAFIPQDTWDDPCNTCITLVVENGKEFKAHRHILAEASPFFGKLLNSDMKEPKKGVVRLEMVTEPVLGDTLEFIYTGYVQIWFEDRARDLIAMADYLLLSNLKMLAERALANHLNYANSVSIYHFGEAYRCEELISNARRFVFDNFLTVAKTDGFLNMSIKEVEMWISSDEIHVFAEEDVFKFILTWIGCDVKGRKKYFAELLHHVRLRYVSPGYLKRRMVTNELEKDNEGCWDLVKDAIKSANCENYDTQFVTPRKSLEFPVILFSEERGDEPNLYTCTFCTRSCCLS